MSHEVNIVKYEIRSNFWLLLKIHPTFFFTATSCLSVHKILWRLSVSTRDVFWWRQWSVKTCKKCWIVKHRLFKRKIQTCDNALLVACSRKSLIRWTTEPVLFTLVPLFPKNLDTLRLNLNPPYGRLALNRAKLVSSSRFCCVKNLPAVSRSLSLASKTSRVNTCWGLCWPPRLFLSGITTAFWLAYKSQIPVSLW